MFDDFFHEVDLSHLYVTVIVMSILACSLGWMVFNEYQSQQRFEQFTHGYSLSVRPLNPSEIKNIYLRADRLKAMMAIKKQKYNFSNIMREQKHAPR